MTPKPTPRTDAFFSAIRHQRESVEFARQLERELDQECQDRKHQMTRMETLELLAPTLGIQLEHARQQGLDADPPPIDMTQPLTGFEDPEPREVWINVGPHGRLGNIHRTREDAEAVSAEGHVTTRFAAQP